MTGPSSGPRVVVLGASGYLGSVVAGLLSARPVRLRAVGRRHCHLPPSARADVETVAADLTDRDQLAAAVADADAVLHLAKHSGSWRAAGHDPAASGPVNVGIMRDLVEIMEDRPATRPAPLVVLAAASSQVGRPPDHPMDGRDPDRPETEYDRQKLAAERILKAATARGVIRGVSLRVATAFGHSPLSDVPDIGVVTTMVRRALADQPLPLWHDGTVVRDLSYVEDVAGAFLAALDRPDRLVGQHWMVGSGRPDRLVDVFRTVAASVAAHTGRPPVPVVPVDPPDEAQVTDFWSVFLDPGPFRSASGWSVQVSLRDGIDRTVSGLLDPRELADTNTQ